MRPLIADGGEVTVLRTLAAYAYGKWSVTWPDSVPEEQIPTLGEDREFGFVWDMPRNPGRLGRRFVRADVAITAAEHDVNGHPIPTTGVSDVEERLDDAQRRTDGNVFLEKEIDRSGMNGNVPGVDFQVGDIVPVSVWGKLIDLPVTAIEAATAPGAVVDWKVHVGGQLVSDVAAREKSNAELLRVIAQERREREQAVSSVDSKASSAVESAAAAKATADDALIVARSSAASLGELQVDVDAASGAASKASHDVAVLTPKVTAAQQEAAAATGAVNTLTPQVAAATSTAAKASQDVAALTPKVTAAQQQAATATQNVSALTPKVTAATDAANKATQDVATLTPKVTAAADTATKASQDVAALTPQVTNAANVAARASQDVATLTPKVTAATDAASKATQDVSTLTTSLNSLSTSTNQKIASASETASNALADANKAIAWLENPFELGDSLLAVQPGTATPLWTTCAIPDQVALPDGTTGTAWRNSTTAKQVRVPSHKVNIRVNPKAQYKVSFWAKSSGSTPASFYFRFLDQDGAYCVKSQTTTAGPSSWWIQHPVSATYIDPANGWVWCERMIEFKPGTDYVSLASLGWNEHGDGYIWLHDVRFAPHIPSQADVDRAQNQAIEANRVALAAQATLNANQAKWNSGVDAALATQALVNSKQDSWNKAVTDSQAAQSTLNLNQAKWNKAVDDSLAAQKTLNDNQLAWNKAVTDSQTAQATLNANQAKWNQAVTDSLSAQDTLNSRQGAWNKAVDDSLAAQNTLNLNQSKWNQAVTDSLAAQKTLNDNQGAWNKAVTDSLAAQSTLNSNQAKWNQAATDAITALNAFKDNQAKWNQGATDAITALQSQNVGSNLLPLAPGSFSPAWTTNSKDPAGSVNDTVYPGFRYWTFDKTYAAAHNKYTAVDDSLEYDFSVWLNGTNESKLYIELRNQDGVGCVESGGIVNNQLLESPVVANGQVVEQQTGSGYLVNNMTLLSGWRQYKTRIRLRKGTRFVRVGAIYGSHPNGPAGVAYVGDMRLTVHQVPQADIDAAQNLAIENNKRDIMRMFMAKHDEVAIADDKKVAIRMPTGGRLVLLGAQSDWVGRAIVIMHYSDGSSRPYRFEKPRASASGDFYVEYRTYGLAPDAQTALEVPAPNPIAFTQWEIPIGNVAAAVVHYQTYT